MDSLAELAPLGRRAAAAPTVDDDILLSSAKQQFPILNNLGVNYKYNPGGGPGFLEFWPSGEEGTPETPRPQEFPMDGIGVEVRDPNTRPIDIMADVASHHLIHTDPVIKQHYEDFTNSMTPGQSVMLHRQYQHAVQNEGEQRPFEHWADQVGLPGWFRGYAFNQWDRPEEIYTPQQMRRFDQMMNYLRKAR